MKKITPLKAIKAKCLDCCGYQKKEVKFCSALNCPIWLFRFGRNPKSQNHLFDVSFFEEHINVEVSNMEKILKNHIKNKKEG